MFDEKKNVFEFYESIVKKGLTSFSSEMLETERMVKYKVHKTLFCVGFIYNIEAYVLIHTVEHFKHLLYARNILRSQELLSINSHRRSFWCLIFEY